MDEIIPKKRYWLRGLTSGIVIGAVIFIAMYTFFLMSSNPSLQSIVDQTWYRNVPSFLEFCLAGMALGLIVGWIYGKTKK